MIINDDRWLTLTDEEWLRVIDTPDGYWLDDENIPDIEGVGTVYQLTSPLTKPLIKEIKL